EIIKLDNKTLSDQLEQFIVEVRKSNGQEYKATSFYTGFCALARGISEMFEKTRVINLFDKHQFKSLHRTLDDCMKSLVNDGDKNHAKWLKASWLKELDDDDMQLELSKEKNHAEGIKDPYAESGKSLIPPDILGNAYTP
ncbi:16890_t:CDS:2, partial [Racocetra fulgida]